MLLVLLLFVSTTVALSSKNLEEDEKITDLQELLLNVSNSFRDFGHGIKELGSELNQNFKLTRESNDANAKSAEENLKKVIENVNANAERADENAKKNTEILEKILAKLSKTDDDEGCAELYKKGERSSGKYVIRVPGFRETFQVYCDMKTDGGGWTVFQRRGDYGYPQDYFSKTWDEYKNGFGEVDKEFWLGNDLLSILSRQKVNVLRVDLWDMEGKQVQAKYTTFRVENEERLYRLTVGGYSGDAGDSLSYHNGAAFSTKDRDNDLNVSYHCAHVFKAGWWFFDCHTANLNGLNLRGKYDQPWQGIIWEHWKGNQYSLAFTEMKFRPKNF